MDPRILTLLFIVKGEGVPLDIPMFIGHPPIQKKNIYIYVCVCMCMYVYVCMCMYVCMYVFGHNAEPSAIVVDVSKDAFLNDHKEVELQLCFPCGC